MDELEYAEFVAAFTMRFNEDTDIPEPCELEWGAADAPDWVAPTIKGWK